MPLPRWMLSSIIFLVVAGCVLFILAVLNDAHSRYLQILSNLTVILTLAALLAYVYYTSELAREVWTPSASLVFERVPNNPYHFFCIVANHSKRSIQCWCRLNATVYGQDVSLGGFYSAEHPFEAPPFGSMRGHFDISDFLAKANRTLEQVRADTPTAGMKDRLSLQVDFWYCAHGSDVQITHPRQPHYFDFKRDVLVFDV